jgi:hypothetical protein
MGGSNAGAGAESLMDDDAATCVELQLNSIRISWTASDSIDHSISGFGAIYPHICHPTDDSMIWKRAEVTIKSGRLAKETREKWHDRFGWRPILTENTLVAVLGGKDKTLLISFFLDEEAYNRLFADVAASNVSRVHMVVNVRLQPGAPLRFLDDFRAANAHVTMGFLTKIGWSSKTVPLKTDRLYGPSGPRSKAASRGDGIPSDENWFPINRYLWFMAGLAAIIAASLTLYDCTK